MKKSMFIAVVLVGLLSVSICWAGSEVPNLVGDWSVKAEGGVMRERRRCWRQDALQR